LLDTILDTNITQLNNTRWHKRTLGHQRTIGITNKTAQSDIGAARSHSTFKTGALNHSATLPKAAIAARASPTLAVER
jgi:hypothetical protein